MENNKKRRKINHKTIQELAKKLKVASRDLVALDPNNDPFYMSGMPAKQRDGRWIAKFWKEVLGGKTIHPRGINYKLWTTEQVRPDTKKLYLGTKNDWKFARTAITAARYMGLIPYEKIIDNKSQFKKYFYELKDESIHKLTDFSIDYSWIHEKIMEQFETIWRPYPHQDTICEVWIEKSSVKSDVEPVIRKYSANWIIGYTGDISLYHCHDFVRRAVAYYIKFGIKKYRIFYIADFDPVGRNMPISMARKVEYLLAEYCDKIGMDLDMLDIRLESIAVTPQQQKQFNLKPTHVPHDKLKPSKDGRKNPYSTRVRKFKKIHGIAGVVELESLTQDVPEELPRILEERLSRYYDIGIDEFIDEKHEESKEIIEEILEKVDWEAPIELGNLPIDWQPLIDFVESVEIPDAEHTEETDQGIFWLLESHLDYVEQLKRYNLFKYGKEDEWLQEQSTKVLGENEE